MTLSFADIDIEKGTLENKILLKKYENKITLVNISPKVLSSTMVRNEILKRGYTSKLKEYLYVDTINYLKKIDVESYWR